MNNYIYIAVMAAVSYTIRVLPLTLIRKPIKNQFIQSFLYYVPYVTLAVMTFPAIIHATRKQFGQQPNTQNNQDKHGEDDANCVSRATLICATHWPRPHIEKVKKE
jgi:beta-lactamase regulating signal transducer with metallopeptidase domain